MDLYYGRPVAGQPSAASTAQGTPTHRPTTPDERNPFGDGLESQASHRAGPQAGNGGTNPFGTPSGSRPESTVGSASGINRFEERAQRYFQSRRVRKGEVEKPWLAKTDPKEKWVTILPILGILVGLGISGFLVWDGLRSVVHHKYKLVLDENFSQGLRSEIWKKEVTVGGFGNGEFQQTTGGDENVYVEGGVLKIKATLQDETLIAKDSVIDLTADGTCTSTLFRDCYAATNTTSGNATIVPPTKSGRINTKDSISIKYGRVEVTAKMPLGDWLWPAIWMMPVNETYGAWPRSGEIDIMESRGNDYLYAQGGNNIMSSALHWGLNAGTDAWWKTNNKRQALKSTYSSGFNTFGLEWSQNYLFTYVNSRLLQTMYVNFDTPLWKRGNFPEYGGDGKKLDNVFAEQNRNNVPFDHRFYLILNVGVGGTNNWFEDGKSNKPWLNSSPNAKKDFWAQRDVWHPTWKQPQMEISRVQVWQQDDGNEEL
ncbi:beta-1,3-glucan-binding protein [Gaeumannomyces tritici R3-111a-1]|uniref:Beta-1,3-glucan-binding protein n=1 Tax=Gaeumannomyces tritici (strain R3-111a-1) TaxID=644352 RepID=J3PE69_GAET3|nr:beta-1,3-glucan-binding protein [Gaeumannomyces tritici R3-111a-1]EJT70769.1 beta-1,3-glucan-binding protein [Gaeumannomyces tritici R3-111a-1]